MELPVKYPLFLSAFPQQIFATYSNIRFSAPVQTGPGAHPASCTMGTGSFLGGKAAGAWSWSTTLSSTEVEGRVELYIYSPSGPSWPVIR
jgi:hypothetical protein